MPDQVEILRAEYAQVPDREIMLHILSLLRQEIDDMSDLKNDMYGDLARGIEGIKPQVVAMARTVDRFKMIAVTVGGFVSLVGIANLVALLSLTR